MALESARVTDSPTLSGTRAEIVEITGIAAGGDGVGRLADGRVVFVPRAAPGEGVRLRTVRAGKRWVRAEIEAVEVASPQRRAAPCPLYDRCGGCQLQHLDPGAQLEAKTRIVGDALRRIGGLDVGDPPIEPSPAELHYRSRVTFTLRRLAGQRVVAGFHHRSHPGRIIDVDTECLLPEAPIGPVWHTLREAWGQGARRLPPGPTLRLTLRIVDGGVLLAIEGGRAGGDLERLAAEMAGLSAIWHAPEGGDWRWIAGERVSWDDTGADRVQVGPGVFSQVNRAAADRLHRAVVGAVGDPRDLDIVDAYCGMGVRGRQLAREGGRVVGLELDAQAVQAARAGAPDGFTVIRGAAEQTLGSVIPADRLIVNPPRTGLDAEIPRLLRESPVQRIVYVSCDPATLARDLERLGDGYAVRTVRAFDLFPQTAHVETMVTLEHVAAVDSSSTAAP